MRVWGNRPRIETMSIRKYMLSPNACKQYDRENRPYLNRITSDIHDLKSVSDLNLGVTVVLHVGEIDSD